MKKSYGYQETYYLMAVQLHGQHPDHRHGLTAHTHHRNTYTVYGSIELDTHLVADKFGKGQENTIVESVLIWLEDPLVDTREGKHI